MKEPDKLAVGANFPVGRMRGPRAVPSPHFLLRVSTCECARGARAVVPGSGPPFHLAPDFPLLDIAASSFSSPPPHNPPPRSNITCRDRILYSRVLTLRADWLHETLIWLRSISAASHSREGFFFFIFFLFFVFLFFLSFILYISNDADIHTIGLPLHRDALCHSSRLWPGESGKFRHWNA
jgi:hypothetical protein